MKHFRLGVLCPFLFVIAFSSCKKDEITLKEQSWSTEIYSNMKDIYLWEDALPSTFKENKYTKAQDALDFLIGLKIDPQTGNPIDRYSFLDKIGSLSGEIQGGTANGDFGFMVTVGYNPANEISFFVNYVYKNSPAAAAGIERSFEVVKINGSTEVHPTVGTDGYLVSTSAGYANMTKALFNSNSSTFTFKKADGTTKDVSVSAKSYSINSVLCDTMYTAGTKKVGYMVFNEFLGAPAQTEITNTITRFENSGVQDLIIDLRYNGGGSVETCEKFCNLIAPVSANTKRMYSNNMNTMLTQYYTKQKFDLTTNFNKTNTFQPEKIYFIVSGGTASASELLINNLRPYYSGSLFIIGQTTYGKPCGFWATPIGYTENQTTPKEGYDLYAVSMETRNANNEGSYYSGMTPGSTQYPGVIAYDSYYLSWGNTNDECLNQALTHISMGAFKAVSSQSKVKSSQVVPVCTIDRQFKGMIDFRKHLNLNRN